MWKQLEFDFGPDPKPKKKRIIIDYDMLYARLLEGPVTFQEIKDLCNLESRFSVSQVITTLSIKYPVWSPKRGLYKLCESSDYQTVNPLIEE